MKKGSRLLIGAALCIGAGPIFAQQTNDDTLTVNELQPVTVTAFRLETSELATPLSMTRIGEKQLQTGTQQLSLDEALMGVPGVFVQNGSNFAQDIRLSIRGFGSRSAFGIRGVKVKVDGFPESTPDGTAQVDAIDPGSLTGISVIRSGTGGLYGNASGGTVNFSTMKFSEKEWGEVGVNLGSYGFRKYQFRAGGGLLSKLRYSMNGAYTGINGYREHSSMKNYLFNAGLLLPLDSISNIRLVATYVNSPLAEDPGGLSEKEAKEDPKQSSNISQDVGEDLWQLRIGVALDKRLSSKNSLKTSLFHTSRSFNSRLFNDIVAFERSFTGGTFSHTHKNRLGKIGWEIITGIDLESQTDDRKRFGNSNGKIGNKLANQVESFASAGGFVVQRFEISKKLILLPAFRYDLIFIM